MSEPIRIFLGYDKREAIAHYVCQQSILDNTKSEVSFHPVTGDPRNGSNAFTFARYLVPHRCRFQGTAIFMDGDMLVRGDIAELDEYARKAPFGAHVVKHDYKTKHATKYLGAPNVDYERKQWASVIAWDCAFYPNRVLTPDFVHKQDPMYLRQFRWLKDEQIGELPMAWNRLVMEQELEPDDRLRHFTIGAPCFAEYADCDGADEWHQTLTRVMEPMKL